MDTLREILSSDIFGTFMPDIYGYIVRKKDDLLCSASILHNLAIKFNFFGNDRKFQKCPYYVHLYVIWT